MKQTIEIEVPEGFEVKYNPETMKVEMVKKDDRPRTMEEFYNNYIDRDSTMWTQILTSKEEAKAFIALSKLRQFRKAWVKNWEPDWNSRDNKWCIYLYENSLHIFNFCKSSKVLSFPTKEMAEEFLECFKDLLETAKVLL